MDSIQVLNKEKVIQSIGEVRSDNSPKNWILLSHKNGNYKEIVLSSDGENGVGELIEHLSNDQVEYALLRLSHKIDWSNVVRFVAIHIIPSDMGLAESARFGRAHGVVEDLLGQTHVTIEVGSKQDLSEEFIVSRISAAAGTNNNISDSNGEGNIGSLKNYRFTPLLSPSSAKTSSVLDKSYSFLPDKSTKTSDIKAEDEVLNTISCIKKALTSDNWMVCSYRDNDFKQPLYLVAKGTRGLKEMKNYFNRDSISYGFTRLDTSLDGNKYTKLVFIHWIGSSVSAVKKAKACVQAGSVTNIFGDFHLEITADDLMEIDEDAIMQKVSS